MPRTKKIRPEGAPFAVWEEWHRTKDGIVRSQCTGWFDPETEERVCNHRRTIDAFTSRFSSRFTSNFIEHADFRPGNPKKSTEKNGVGLPGGYLKGMRLGSVAPKTGTKTKGTPLWALLVALLLATIKRSSVPEEATNFMRSHSDELRGALGGAWPEEPPSQELLEHLLALVSQDGLARLMETALKVFFSDPADEPDEAFSFREILVSPHPLGISLRLGHGRARRYQDEAVRMALGELNLRGILVFANESMSDGRLTDRILNRGGEYIIAVSPHLGTREIYDQMCLSGESWETDYVHLGDGPGEFADVAGLWAFDPGKLDGWRLRHWRFLRSGSFLHRLTPAVKPTGETPVIVRRVFASSLRFDDPALLPRVKHVLEQPAPEADLVLCFPRPARYMFNGTICRNVCALVNIIRSETFKRSYTPAAEQLRSLAEELGPHEAAREVAGLMKGDVSEAG